MREIKAIGIKELIEDNERIVQLAIVHAENGEDQSVRDLVNSLYEIFLEIYGFRNTHSEKYRALMHSVIQLRAGGASKVDRDVYDEQSYLSNYRQGLVRIWNQAYKSHLWSASNSLVLKVQMILKRLTSVEGNEKEVTEFLFLLSQISGSALRADREVELEFLENPTYQWYYNLVFLRSPDPLLIHYLDSIDTFFWRSLQGIVDSSSMVLFEGFLTASHHKGISGATMQIHNFIDDIYLVRLIEEKLSYVGKNEGLTVYGFLGILSEVESIIDGNEHLISSEFRTNQVMHWIKIGFEDEFKLHRIRDHFYILGAYLLFKRRFDWIFELWNYRQPLDADVKYVSDPFLPKDLAEIFVFIIDRDVLTARNLYEWNGHHGISTYYRSYGVLLIARLFVLRDALIPSNTRLDIDSFLRSMRGAEELDLLSQIELLCDRMKESVDIIDNLEFLSGRVVYSMDGRRVFVKQAVSDILSEIARAAKLFRENLLNSDRVSNEDMIEYLQVIEERFISYCNLLQVFNRVQPDAGEDVRSSVISYAKEMQAGYVNDQAIRIGYEKFAVDIAISLDNRFLQFVRYELLSQFKDSISKVSFEKISPVFRSYVESLRNWQQPIIVGLGEYFGHWFDEQVDFVPLRQPNFGGYAEYKFVNNENFKVYGITQVSGRSWMLMFDAKHFGKIELETFRKGPGDVLSNFLSLEYNSDDSNTMRILLSSRIKTLFFKEPRFLVLEVV